MQPTSRKPHVVSLCFPLKLNLEVVRLFLLCNENFYMTYKPLACEIGTVDGGLFLF